MIGISSGVGARGWPAAFEQWREMVPASPGHNGVGFTRARLDQI